jgi:mannose-6-phosphate isomerase-like protein (cupin superfamily)
MATEPLEIQLPETTADDEVQIFDTSEAVKKRDHISGRVDMGKSPNSFIAVFKTPPRGGETHIHQHPDSDQVLYVLKGEITVEGLSGKYKLNQQQGVLIPAGVHYGFTNEGQEDVHFLSFRTESTGGRRVAYVKNVPSKVHVKIPADAMMAKGIGRHIYVFALDRTTIGISTLLLGEWNNASLLRMNCDFEKDGDAIIAKLPERLARWYKIDSLLETDYQLIREPDGTRVRLDLGPLIKREGV